MPELSKVLLHIAPPIAILIVGAFLIKGLEKLVKKILLKSSVDPMLHKFIINALTIAAWAILIVSALKMLGVDTSSVLTLFAACGAAVALALQGSLSNLASGILLMFSTPFKKGDYITCAGFSGSVDSINLLHTTLLTVDNVRIIVPNSTFTANAISNSSAMDTRRVDISIGIAYDSDVEKAKRAVMELAASSGYILDKPDKPVCLVSSYGDKAITLTYKGWVMTENYWAEYNMIQNGLKAALDAAGVEIPFPRIDVRQKA